MPEFSHSLEGGDPVTIEPGVEVRSALHAAVTGYWVPAFAGMTIERLFDVCIT